MLSLASSSASLRSLPFGLVSSDKSPPFKEDSNSDYSSTITEVNLGWFPASYFFSLSLLFLFFWPVSAVYAWGSSKSNLSRTWELWVWVFFCESWVKLNPGELWKVTLGETILSYSLFINISYFTPTFPRSPKCSYSFFYLLFFGSTDRESTIRIEFIESDFSSFHLYCLSFEHFL